MISNREFKPTLDPEAPGLDEDTRRRRRALAKMEQMSPEELFQLAVRAGIYTPEGELTPPYQNDEPSAYRDYEKEKSDAGGSEPVLFLDPEAPGLDEDTRRRRRVLVKMQQQTPEELFQGAVRAGIYTADGQLTAPYRDDEPSAYRSYDDDDGDA